MWLVCAREDGCRLEHGEDDQRSHQITITEKGRALLRRSYPVWQKAQHLVAQRLGLDGIAALKAVVAKLRG